MSFQLKGVWVGPGGTGRVLFVGMGNVILAVDQSAINGPDQTGLKRRCLDTLGIRLDWTGQAWFERCLFGPILINWPNPEEEKIFFLFFILKAKLSKKSN